MSVVPSDEITVIDRENFIRDYWDYKPGEHVTIIGPTRRGKTYLGFQLLDATTSKKLQGFVLWSKPRDEGTPVEVWAKRLNYKMIETYPPPYKFRKPPGYVLKPHQTLKDLKLDEREITKEFRACIMDCYSSKDARIVFIDEAQEVQGPLGLKKECEAMWKRGSGLHCGCWALAQRSAYNSLDMYNAPEHLFLFNDPDKKNRERFGEIGGVDRLLVERLTNELGQYQVLYIKRTGGYLPCIVNP
jgi:hypothetical protein